LILERKEHDMRVFIAGGTGAVGKRLVPLLVARGHEVTATTTRPGALEQLRALGANPVVMDGLDAASVAAAVEHAGPDVLVHQMTALAGADFKHFEQSFATTNELRTRGTEYLLEAAEAVGVPRFVAQGFYDWPSARAGGPPKTEEDPPDPNPPAAVRPLFEALHRQEELLASAPLETVVLRYGALYGPGASDELVELVRKRRVPLIGDSEGVWSWLHVDDAATANVAAVEGHATGVFNIVDDEPAPMSECLPYLAAVFGAKAPRRLPVWLARPLAGQAVVALMTRSRGSSNAKAKRELGWRPLYSSWRQGFVHGLGQAPIDPRAVEEILGEAPPAAWRQAG
jgi:2-alkyl-3-oxoalkanoate reductase